MRRLNKIVDNTGGLLDEAKQAKKRTGPGDIIFKNLPEALAVRGEWKEERFNRAASCYRVVSVSHLSDCRRCRRSVCLRCHRCQRHRLSVFRR